MVDKKPQICNPQNPCPSNYYCHIGVADQYYCCPAQGIFKTKYLLFIWLHNTEFLPQLKRYFDKINFVLFILRW